MLRLRDIMTTELVTLDPNLTVREAMDVFTSKRISGAPVVAGEEVLGVVSATDLLEFAASVPGLPMDGELAAHLVEDDGDDEVDDARPRSDDDAAGSYFTEQWDVTSDNSAARTASNFAAEWNSLEEHTVSELMTRAPLHALTPETFVPIAADYLRRAKIHRVLVMKGQKLLGIVTTSDIADAVADGKLTSRTYVFDRQVQPVVRRR